MSRILTSLHGKLGGFDSDGVLISAKGFRSGTNGNQVDLPSPSKVVLFDDFLGDLLADEWAAVETDTDATQAVVAGGIGGVLRLTSGNDDGNVVVLPDASGITSYLNWQASNGGLTFQTRIKLSRIALAYAFIGFTDLITIEAPVIASGTANGITTNASDAVGFMFDTGMEADVWHLVGVAGNTDATRQSAAVAPVADDYATFRIEVNASGVAVFFINGIQVGTAMTGAVTAATDLTPVLLVSNTDGTDVVSMDVDYVHVAMNRAADGDAV